MFTVYTKPNCYGCLATIRKLDQLNQEHNKILITPKEAEEITEKYGYTQAPVVVIGEHHWCGYRPDLITKHAAK